MISASFFTRWCILLVESVQIDTNTSQWQNILEQKLKCFVLKTDSTYRWYPIHVSQSLQRSVSQRAARGLRAGVSTLAPLRSPAQHRTRVEVTAAAPLVSGGTAREAPCGARACTACLEAPSVTNTSLFTLGIYLWTYSASPQSLPLSKKDRTADWPLPTRSARRSQHGIKICVGTVTLPPIETSVLSRKISSLLFGF